MLIASACLIPATLDAFQQYMQGRLSGQGARWQDMTFQGSEWIFFGILTPITYHLGKHFPPSRKHWMRSLLVHTAGALALCFGWASLGVLLGIVLHRYPAVGPLKTSYLSWLLISLPYSVFLYFAVLGSVYAFTYFVEARRREFQAATLSAQLAEARLGALRMQLNPHFLFNSLNALSVLVNEQKTPEASRMLDLLSDVLRHVLKSETSQQVPLSSELTFLRQYFAIEQVRFSDRLRIRWSIDERARDALVPNFILQPLAENAIRHGIARRAESGNVEVAAEVKGSMLMLVVRDDGAGYRAATSPGVGLSNTRERLAGLYGDTATLSVEALPAGGTEATITMPFIAGGRST